MPPQLQNLPNPYDFANPVDDEKLFFGRTGELSDIIYYLNHAQRTARPIHLAFVGARASGKTSFLNITELEARRRDFCVVRINLNEGDTETDFDFFRKLFHSVVMGAFANGAFGGKSGPFYFKYLELLATHKTDDLEKLPLVFAFQLARALAAGTNSFHVADDILFEDLKLIKEQIGKPIIILFDECNTLRASRIILEKLRNIFMNMSGYMLVFAATDDFFPVMDEVFSPILRQFKKIDIGPFKSLADVRDCIMQPLYHLGIARSDARLLVPRMFVADTDTLSGRRPYEIQLICHTLFRRCQEGLAPRFSLDLKTIQSIQQEIASGQNIDQRPIIQAARQLKRKTLSLLDTVGISIEPTPIADCWALEHAFDGENRWTNQDFMSGTKELIQTGVLREQGGNIFFAGDELDRVYIKYLARQKGVTLLSTPQPFEVLIFRKSADYFRGFQAAHLLGGFQTDQRSDELLTVTKFLEPDSQVNSLPDSPWVGDLLEALVQLPEGFKIILFDLFFVTASGPFQMWLFWKEPEQVSTLKKFQKSITDLQHRCGEIGYSLEVRQQPFTVATHDYLVSRVKTGASEQFATRLSGALMREVGYAYVEERDKVRARRLGETAFAVSNSRLTPEANNMGYLSMAHGDFAEARRWFQAAEQYNLEKNDRQLLAYNYGVLDALTGDYASARTHFQRAKVEASSDVGCVFKLVLDEGKLTYEEIFEPPTLGTLTDDALHIIDQLDARP